LRSDAVLSAPTRRCTARPQSDFAKNKWKGLVFVGSVTLAGLSAPWFCVSFAQKKSGTW
jgi:hypothetical protein